MKNIRQSYKGYKAKAESPVDLKSYLSLTAEFNKFLIREILNGNEVTLPARMGTLKISGKKQKVTFGEDGKVRGLAPDWVGTKNHWLKKYPGKTMEELKDIKDKPLLYHTNAHTDNVRYKYLWSKNRVLVENKTLYSLRMTRANKRAAHSAITQGKDFITV